MSRKRITIYDVATALNLSGSYVSRALNDHPSVSAKAKELVKRKAEELNYRHNSSAANLRRGTSKTIGVVVPHINQSFFSEAIAGIEEICFEKNYSLIICQSHDSFANECQAIETLIHQNIDAILISVSAETKTFSHLENVQKNHITLIQFDRCMDQLPSYQVVNDNMEASFAVVKNLIKEGYRKIAFLGGPEHLSLFNRRKEGYLKAIKEEGLMVPYNYIVDNVLSISKASVIIRELLLSRHPPDAFFTVSDHQSLAVLKVAETLGLRVPEDIGIFGYANESFSALITPALSSVDQKSKEIGKAAAQIYFENILKGTTADFPDQQRFIKSEIIIRHSSIRVLD